MNTYHLQKSRLLVGLGCLIVAVLLLVLGEGSGATVGAVAFAVLALISWATSRKSTPVS